MPKSQALVSGIGVSWDSEWFGRLLIEMSGQRWGGRSWWSGRQHPICQGDGWQVGGGGNNTLGVGMDQPSSSGLGLLKSWLAGS